MKQQDSSLRSEQFSLGKTILKKLSTIEDLLKRKDDKPLTFKEACTYLGYAPSYLYKLTYKNVVPHYKPTGKIIFFSKNELDEWIFKSRIRQTEGGQGEKMEDSWQNENDTSASLVARDPNQIEMDLTEDASADPSLRSGQGSAQELLIEFPLKSRRKK